MDYVREVRFREPCFLYTLAAAFLLTGDFLIEYSASFIILVSSLKLMIGAMYPANGSL